MPLATTRRTHAVRFQWPPTLALGAEICHWPGRCGQGFARQNNCKRHESESEQLHRNFRPFECEGCWKVCADGRAESVRGLWRVLGSRTVAAMAAGSGEYAGMRGAEMDVGGMEDARTAGAIRRVGGGGAMANNTPRWVGHRSPCAPDAHYPLRYVLSPSTHRTAYSHDFSIFYDLALRPRSTILEPPPASLRLAEVWLYLFIPLILRYCIHSTHSTLY